MKKHIQIAPSILASNFATLEQEIKALENSGADMIHLDVMDYHFVPNLTFGAPVITKIRSVTKLTFDAHLMIENPHKYVDDFIKAGADIITVHPEAVGNVKEAVRLIKKAGKKAGVALNPETEIAVLDDYLPMVDLVLVMTVHPGFSGQKHLPLYDKIKAVKEKIRVSGKNILVEVDGGITPQVAPEVIKAGADILVAGAAIFQYPLSRYKDIIKSLRGE